MNFFRFAVLLVSLIFVNVSCGVNVGLGGGTSTGENPVEPGVHTDDPTDPEPDPGQTVPVGTRFSVGGTVTGLPDTLSFVLDNNTSTPLNVTGSVNFTFPTNIESKVSYKVTVKAHPDGYHCTVIDGEGVVSNADVTNILVRCVVPKNIFVSTSTYTGNMGGINGADSKCQSDDRKPKTGTYKALMVDASGRTACEQANCSGQTGVRVDWILLANMTYQRAYDRKPIFTTNENGIFDFELIDVDGAFTNRDIFAWTGIARDWLTNTSYSRCLDWTSALSDKLGTVGHANEKNSRMISTIALWCNTNAHLICVEQ